MSRKRVKRRAAAASEDMGGGFVANIVDRAFENPASSGGLMVMALTATAIVSNAMFLQSGRHPDQLFAPRPASIVQQQDIDTAPAPDAITAVSPPLPRPAPGAAEAPATAAPPVADQALISNVQRELARLGLYSGAIDGIAGARTAAAISAYENAAGLAPSGKPTADLLAAMRAPLPPRAPVATVGTSAPTAAELDSRERERAAKIAADEQAMAGARLKANYRIVQDALNRAGYGPISVDGEAGKTMADAIRRFELDNGLPLTGQLSDRLMGRLISIGALRAT